MSIRIQDRILLSLQEAVHMSGYPSTALETHIQRGSLPVYEHRGESYVDEIDLHRLIRLHEQHAQQQKRRQAKAEALAARKPYSVTTWIIAFLIAFAGAFVALYAVMPKESSFVIEGSNPSNEELAAFAGGFLGYLQDNMSALMHK